MALSSNDRAEVWAKFMRDGISSEGLTKAQLRAVVDAVDDWADANAASYNTALPAFARGANTSSSFKALVLAFVALKRAGR